MSGTLPPSLDKTPALPVLAGLRTPKALQTINENANFDPVLSTAATAGNLRAIMPWVSLRPILGRNSLLLRPGGLPTSGYLLASLRDA